MTATIDCSDQTVLVTGGATGLGLAIAEAFGRAGATIALNDLAPERVDQATAILTQQGVRCLGVAADVRDQTQVRRLVGRVVTEVGVPDVAIANAGVYIPTHCSSISRSRSGTACWTRT